MRGIPATKRHEDIQGEILEGLVARIVTPESLTILKEVLVQYPPPPVPESKHACFSFPNSVKDYRVNASTHIRLALCACHCLFCFDCNADLDVRLI